MQVGTGGSYNNQQVLEAQPQQQQQQQQSLSSQQHPSSSTISCVEIGEVLSPTGNNGAGPPGLMSPTGGPSGMVSPQQRSVVQATQVPFSSVIPVNNIPSEVITHYL